MSGSFWFLGYSSSDHIFNITEEPELKLESLWKNAGATTHTANIYNLSHKLNGLI